MKDVIHKFISESLLAGDNVADDEELLLSGLLDSLGVMRLVSHLEKECGVSIPPDDVVIENFETVNAIAAYMETRQQSAAPVSG